MRGDAWPCSREAGCDVTIATMTPGDCGSAEHDCRGDRRDPPRRGPGVGRADRGRLSLPGIPRPGDLQRRRVAAAGHRGSAAGPARPHPDRAAGRLHLRPRDDQPAGPRRLLRGVVPELRDAAVGAGPSAARDPAPLLRRSPRGRDRDGGRCRSISTSTSRGSSRPSGRCSPVTPASATGCSGSTGSTSTWRARRGGVPSRGAEIGVAQAEAFRQYRGIPIRRTICS